MGGFYFFGVCGDLFEEEEDSFARDVCSTGVVMAEYVLLLNQLSWVSDLVVALALLKHTESRRKLAAAVADGFFLESAWAALLPCVVRFFFRHPPQRTQAPG